MKDYENSCEYFLFDSKSKEYGGSGKIFDKNLLQKYKLSKSYFISGGIDSPIENCFAIDVNSKFEIEPGLKDINKLKKLFNEVHGR